MVNFIASKVAPNPKLYEYWVDLTENVYGGILKYFNGAKWDYLNNKDEQDLDLSNIKQFLQNIQKNNIKDIHVNEINSDANQVNVILNETSYSVSESGEIVNSDKQLKQLNISAATQTNAGVLTSTDKTKLDNIEEHANNYTLPVATADVLGGIKIGAQEDLDGKKYALRLDEQNRAYILIPVDSIVINNLTSDDVDRALSSAQGKVLKAMYDELNTKYSELEARVIALETPSA